MQEPPYVDPRSIATALAEQLPRGIFLCVGGDTPNVMTIGWGGLSFYWGKNIFVAPIRPQRFTHDLLQKQKTFTLCVPFARTMSEALQKAGTLSGKDGNKFEAMGLQTLPAANINAPVLPGCAYVLECSVLSQNRFTRPDTDPSISAKMYPADDFHTLFYGEILACYTGE